MSKRAVFYTFGIYTEYDTLSSKLAKRVDLQLVWKTSLQDIVESPTLLKSVSILTTEGPDGVDSTHITLLVDGKIYFLRPEFLVWLFGVGGSLFTVQACYDADMADAYDFFS